MLRTVAIGVQDFETIRKNNYFYVDKTDFIKEWWEAGDSVTLIARPRRFGKTLNMSMLEKFFSIEYTGRSDLFEGLSIWKEEKYRKLQGTYPVIFLSFARVKEVNYVTAKAKICEILRNLYNRYAFIKESKELSDSDRAYFNRILSVAVNDSDATSALYQLSGFLYRYYGKKPIILLDEYDTPMQEAYVNGYWNELVAFIRSLFNSTFKTNDYLERGLMTGITRVSKESIFSDLNNLKVVTTTSDEYATTFGFTEQEVFTALDEYGYSNRKSEVKDWYDGFTFGQHKDIYNPWSIINFLDTGKAGTYWANTSSNSLVGKLIREGNKKIKISFEQLLSGKGILCPIDEQIVYNQLNYKEGAIWSLLLASGYLKVLDYQTASDVDDDTKPMYTLALTNREIRVMFKSMVSDWFAQTAGYYSDFVNALLADDLDTMNDCMNDITSEIFSFFDTSADSKHPENFYHGFVLGLLVELSKNYIITSNQESGYGRYDVMIEPKDKTKDAMILEFKVYNPRRESSLEEAVQAALRQIDEKRYEASLIQRGFSPDRIKKYGFAFEGKKVLIGEKSSLKENRDSGGLKKLNAF